MASLPARQRLGHLRLIPVAMGALLAAGHPLAAQGAQVPGRNPLVQQALELLAKEEPATINRQIALCQIPAPPFKETVRAQAFRDSLVALGLRNVRIDSAGNVIAERPGKQNLPAVVLSGHLDTVFPEGTDVTVSRSGPVLKGPGIEDNCRGLAIVLAVARTLEKIGISTDAPIWFVGTVGEEGPGNLRGVKYLFDREAKGRIGHFISIDADELNAVKDAVGSYRYTVTFSGPGGHSFGAFGMPNPMHALGRAIAAIADLQVPANPRTTFSVGILEGGTTVNSIPSQAAFQIDLRSEDPTALDALDAKFRQAVNQAVAQERARWPGSEAPLEVNMERWGLRPAGTQAESARIVQATRESADFLGFAPRFSASSTDANYPIWLGIPSVTIGGGGRGSNGHSLNEEWDSTDSHLGTQWSLLLTLTLAGVR